MKLAGRYRLLNPLGDTDSAVRLAFDEALHRDVAVKELRVPPELRQNAVHDARAAAGLRHPSLVPVHEVLDEGWVVMEFVSGGSLEAAVASRHPLPVAQAARMGLQVFHALATAHGAGLVHGRVNPGSVLLTTTGRAVLTGLCGPRPGLPASADLWSLAATLHFALEGRPPGNEPAAGGDPLRTLIRDMLDGQVPAETVGVVLNNLALPQPPAPPPPPPPLPGPVGPPPPAWEEAAVQQRPRTDLVEPPKRGLLGRFRRKRNDAPAPAVSAPAPAMGPPAPVLRPPAPVLRPPAPVLGTPAAPLAMPEPPAVPEPVPPAVPEPQPAPPAVPEPVPVPPAVPEVESQEVRLDQLIGADGPLPPAEVAGVGLALLEHLAGLHAQGGQHGDVRPASVLLDAEGRASLAPPQPQLGNSPYTPPEGRMGPASDLWSLGATLYTAVEGRPPSPGAPLTRAEGLAPLLFRLLAGDPAQRPAPEALREELRLISSQPSDAGTARPPRY
ncbi:protein kinase [Nonomuraea sp. NPDC050328]|uniref:protein kinase n=1 Tax=Nonomuraea sp. NPDC050328 TaxID=3364361 RepID=UPI00379273C7